MSFYYRVNQWAGFSYYGIIIQENCNAMINPLSLKNIYKEILHLVKTFIKICFNKAVCHASAFSLFQKENSSTTKARRFWLHKILTTFFAQVLFSGSNVRHFALSRSDYLAISKRSLPSLQKVATFTFAKAVLFIRLGDTFSVLKNILKAKIFRSWCCLLYTSRCV